jgi:hypothetical protein
MTSGKVTEAGMGVGVIVGEADGMPVGVGPAGVAVAVGEGLGVLVKLDSAPEGTNTAALGGLKA